jgi:hypothetical protein
LTSGEGGVTMTGAVRRPVRSMGRGRIVAMWGRPRFDGDMVSQDALPRTITLVNQMEKNLTADTQLALAA